MRAGLAFYGILPKSAPERALKTCPTCQTECATETKFCPNCGEGISEVEPSEDGDSLTGKVIAGNFRLGEVIGTGAMGAIYKAEQLSLGKTVAIKLLHRHLLSDPTLIKRFHREARAASRFKHANAIDVIDFGQAENGALFIAMEYVHGRDLADVIHADWPLDYPRLIKILQHVCLALDEAHAVGIIHRDLKPENIMLEDRRTEKDFVKVLDFGIAKIQDPHSDPGDSKQGWQTVAGVVCGTPEYMAPEQARGEVLDARADIYSLGIIVFQMLTGKMPFTGDSPIAVVTQHLTEPVPKPSDLRPDVDPGFEKLVIQLLQKNREDRPTTAMEVYHALEKLDKKLHKGEARNTLVGGGRSLTGSFEAARKDFETPHESETKLFSPQESGLVKSLNYQAPAGTEISLTAAGAEDAPPRKGATWPWVILAALLVAGIGFGVWQATQSKANSATDSAEPTAEKTDEGATDDPQGSDTTGTDEAGAAATSPNDNATTGGEPAATEGAAEPTGQPAAQPAPSAVAVDVARRAPESEAVQRTGPTAAPLETIAPASAQGTDAVGDPIVEPHGQPDVDTNPSGKDPVAVEPKKPTVKKPTVKKPTVKKPTVKKPTLKAPKPAPDAGKLDEVLARAKAAKSAGNWPKAIQAYNEAYAMKKSPTYLKEIGRAYAKRNDLKSACRYFGRYVNRFTGQKRSDQVSRLAFYGCDL